MSSPDALRPRRRPTVSVDVGGVLVGSAHPVVVQSMTNTDTADADGTAIQVARLAHAGSQLVRVTVNSDEAAAAVPEMVRKVRGLGVDVPIVGGLGTLAESIVNRPTQAPPVQGPVGIATQIGDIFWQLGPLFTLYVAGVLSANLAVVNILPFPPLDGGRMLMITLKRFLGARLSVRAEQLTYMVGFVFLFAFLIWITGFDIVRLGGS